VNAHQRRTVAAATVVLACALAAAAAARLVGNAASYADPTGDGASAPDVAVVDVTNDNRGDVIVRVTLANRQVTTAEDWVTLYLDVDDVEDAEGSLQAEYAVVADSDGGHFLRLGDGEPQDVPSLLLTSFASSFANGVLTFRVNQRDLKDTTALNLWLHTGTEVDESFDDAPDGDAVWEYSVISPTLYVLAFSPPTAARAGQTVRGLLTVRGVRRDTARIGCTATIGGRRLQGKADWFTFSLAGGGITSVVKADPRCAWAIPKTARGKLMRGTMTVLQDRLQVSRNFSVRVG
jgi:hypothetical protein